MVKDYYKILNISRTEPAEGIKKAYRIAALFWHPDKNKGANAHDKFIEINEAYNILIDPQKRKIYDELLDLSKSNTEVSVFKSQESKQKYQAYTEWVKEEVTKGEKLAHVSIDNILTDTFHFFDKFGCLILFIILGLFSLIVFAVTHK